MGVDASLVAGMANTLGGRWSTFMDTIDSARLQAVSPVYEQLGNALSVVSDIVNENSDAFGAFATAIGTALAGAIQSVLAFIVMVQNISTDHGLGVFESIITAIEIRIGEVFGETAQAIFHAFVASIQAISDAIATVIDFFNSGSTTSEVLKAVIVGITTKQKNHTQRQYRQTDKSRYGYQGRHRHHSLCIQYSILIMTSGRTPQISYDVWHRCHRG